MPIDRLPPGYKHSVSSHIRRQTIIMPPLPTQQSKLESNFACSILFFCFFAFSLNQSEFTLYMHGHTQKLISGGCRHVAIRKRNMLACENQKMVGLRIVCSHSYFFYSYTLIRSHSSSSPTPTPLQSKPVDDQPETSVYNTQNRS